MLWLLSFFLWKGTYLSFLFCLVGAAVRAVVLVFFAAAAVRAVVLVALVVLVFFFFAFAEGGGLVIAAAFLLLVLRSPIWEDANVANAMSAGFIVQLLVYSWSLLVNCWSIVGQLLVNCWSIVGVGQGQGSGGALQLRHILMGEKVSATRDFPNETITLKFVDF